MYTPHNITCKRDRIRNKTETSGYTIKWKENNVPTLHHHGHKYGYWVAWTSGVLFF